MSSVVSQIQAALGSNFAVSNTSGSTLRVLDDGTGAVSIGSASKTVSATAEKTGATALPLFTDGTGYYTGSFDGGSQMSGYASRIRLNAAVASDPSLMVNYSSTTQSGDSARPQALYSALVDTKSATVLGNGTKANQSTVAGFANSMVSYWAGQADTQQTLVDNQSVIQSNLRSRMSSTSAVDTDTELTKLIQLQNYYSANAQVLSTLRDMLNTLVNAI
jgi:flagellar hook-associated protein 1 FlgK